MTLMSEDLSETIERFERLAAWHRINAERAGALWCGRQDCEPPRILRAKPKIRAQLFDTAKAG
jgi:hypothetical protein